MQRSWLPIHIVHLFSRCARRAAGGGRPTLFDDRQAAISVHCSRLSRYTPPLSLIDPSGVAGRTKLPSVIAVYALRFAN